MLHGGFKAGTKKGMKSQIWALEIVRGHVVDKLRPTYVYVPESSRKYSALARVRAVWDVCPSSLQAAGSGGAQKAPCFRLEGQLRRDRTTNQEEVAKERGNNFVGGSRWLARRLDKAEV